MKKTVEDLALELLAERLPTPYSFGYALAEELQKLTAEDRQKFLVVVLERFQLVPKKDRPARPERTLSQPTFDQLFEQLEGPTHAFCKAIFAARPRTEIFARMLLRFAFQHQTLEKIALILTIVSVGGLLPYVQSLPKPGQAAAKDIEGVMDAHFQEMASVIRLVQECQDMTLWQVADILLQLLPKKGVPRTALLAFFLSRFTDEMRGPPPEVVIQEDGGGDPESDPLPDKKKLN